MKKTLTLLFSISILSTNITAQVQYRYPLDIPISLSANFGELRPNHFHSGIDLRTERVINKPVYSIADGYVSRISVSPSGYGLAIYINHPNGQTSVYGHLEKFAPQIAQYAKQKQYENENYRIDIAVDKNIFPLKKGDLIAYSGNTGSSGGPHVHFEIRETKSGLAVDPLVYYKSRIKDTQSPLLKAIAIYPLIEKGVVNGSSSPMRKNITLLKKGGYAPIKEVIQAWGEIGIGVNAIDKMDGTTSIFGVKTVRLFCDNKEVYSSDMTSVDFATTRMINSFVDFDYWYNKKSFFMKSFLEPGNNLSISKAQNSGYIKIDKEKEYFIRYELEDLWGNKTSYSFSIAGKKQAIPEPPKCSSVMHWDQNNHYITDSFSLLIPKDVLYDNLYFILNQSKTENYLSDVYKVHNSNVPLNTFVEMKLKINNDTLANKSQYAVVLLKDGKESWIGGNYNNGYMDVKIRELGNRYVVSTDSETPSITPLQPEKWVAQKEIKIRLTDTKSGINTVRGTIDGNFALFENDVKSSVYTYRFDTQRLKAGKRHQLVFTASDACDNTSRYEYEFEY